MDELIAKYLNKQISPSEKKELTEWLQVSENRKVFENIVGHWNLTNDRIQQAKRDTLSRVGVSEVTSTKSKQINWFRKVSYYAAASVLIAAMCFTFWDQIENSLTSSNDQLGSLTEVIIKNTDLGEKLTVELPDGSKVKLNTGTTIKYPSNFEGATRDIFLNGEAFFDVKRNEDQPFVVSTKSISVKVLGTSFLVNSNINNKPTVAVKTGLVQVTQNDVDEPILLHPNESVISNQNGLSKSSIEDDLLTFGWLDQKLVFKDNHFNEIIEELSRWYGVHIKVNNGFQSEATFSGTYDNPTLNQVLKSLSFAYKFQYEVNGKEIKIKK